ncbi:MAG: ABC transporter ATP-binding protein [Trueperella sp.]|nr:ABC transporter ATP-binding protein [Trueperella sp.]
MYKERNNSLKSAVMRRRTAVYDTFTAVDDVSFEIPQGTTYALVGDNGSGKSTLLKCIARILVPNKGEIVHNGRISAMLEIGSGFHPELSGRDNIYLNASVLGMTRKEIDARLDEIIDFSGVEEFIDQPVKNYSSGMYVRLGFSVAIHTEPDILLVDEVLAVGDAAFQEKCAQKFIDLKQEGRTIVLVSHSVPQLKRMSDSAVWINDGKLVKVGSAHEVLEAYSDSTRLLTGADDTSQGRWGSGEAYVQGVEILSDGRQVTGPLATGDSVIFRMHYYARERIVNPTFSFSLRASDGTHLWTSNTKGHKFQVGQIAGEGIVELSIPQLDLQSGIFILDAAIMDSTAQHVYDFVHEINGFSVQYASSGESRGYVALNEEWRI